MEQEQCLEKKSISELELMKQTVEFIGKGVELMQIVQKDCIGPLLKKFPKIERTPEEEQVWQKIEKEMDDAIAQSLTESQQRFDAWNTEHNIICAHSRVMFAELPEGSCLSVAQVREDYYARKAKAEAEVALL